MLKAIVKKHIHCASSRFPTTRYSLRPWISASGKGIQLYQASSWFHSVMDKLHTPDVYGSDLVMYETDYQGRHP